MLIYNFGDWTQWLEPQKVTFLPEQKLISINPGHSQIDAQIDLYSAWKEWIRYYDNAKWAAAFTTFGGDSTGESQYAPRYYFLTNGWKVLVRDMSVIVQMNLYSDDGESPFIIQNAAVTNRASDVPIIKSEIEKRLDYGDRIYYDEESIYSGIEYPNGTIAQPVNNIPDAIALSNLYNIKSFYVLSDVNILTSGNIFEGYSIFADRENLTIKAVDGNYFNNMDWTGFLIDLNFGGGENKFIDCVIFNALDVSGQMKSCQINGKVRIWDSLVMSLCYSGIAGSSTPIFDMNEYNPTKFSIRSYSGGVDLRWSNHPQDTCTIELIAGQIKLHETCTSGYIDLRGVGYITDNSSGATVKTTGFIDSFENYIEETREIDERLTYNDRIYYDETSIFSGQTYPIGTIVQPVNNPIDAFQMSYVLNIKKFFCLSDITLLDITGYSISDYAAIGQKENLIASIYDNYVNNFLFDNFSIYANFSGGTNTIVNCSVVDLEGFKGTIKDSKLVGRIDLISDTDIINCFSGDDLTTETKEIPTIYLSSDHGVILDIRNFSGDLSFNKMNHYDDIVTIDVNSGKIIITSGVTNGTIDLRGVGYIQNDAGTGCTIITTGFVDSFGSYLDATKDFDQRQAYGDRIYVDETSIYTGLTYPIGTIGYPINNFNDAVLIAQEYNITDFYALNNIYLNHLTGLTIENYSFFADRENLKFETTGNILNNIDIHNFTIDINFGSGSRNKLYDCIVENALDLSGRISNSQMGTSQKKSTVRIAHEIILSNCYSGVVAGVVIENTPVYDMANSDTYLAIRSYSGGVKIINQTSENAKAVIELIAGHIKLDSTCTSGYIDIRGIGYMSSNNASTGCTIITKGFVDSFETYINESKETNEILAYQGVIYLDGLNGFTGSTYPIGTIANPVNNLSDLITLSNKLKIKDLNIIGSFISQDSSGNTIGIPLDFIGYNNYAVNINSQLTVNSDEPGIIENSKLTGFLIKNSDYKGRLVTIDKCSIENLYNLHGYIQQSSMSGIISIKDDSNLSYCYSKKENNPPIIKMVNNSGTTASFRNYSGDIIIDSMTHFSDFISLDMISGKVIINSGCSDGVIDLRGVGYLIDNSSGTTVITTGFISQTLTSEDVAKLTGITSAIDDMTISVDSLDEKVSYISGTTYEMNENVITMTSGFTEIVDSISGMTDTVNTMTNQIISLEEQVKRILGLVQENFRIMDHVYSGNNLDSATVKIYNDSSDCDSDINPLATYSMTALYDSSGKLVDYKVIKS